MSSSPGLEDASPELSIAVAVASDASDALENAASSSVQDAPDELAASAEVGGLDLLFRGVADPTRIRILNVLVPGPRTVSEIMSLLRLPQSLVSRHLAYLRRAGLVRAERESRTAHYRLADPASSAHASLLVCVAGCFTEVPQLGRERALASAGGAPPLST